jgi:hypothetical protein
MDCPRTKVIVPGDADEFMDWLDNGTIGIQWQHDRAGPTDESEGLETY